MQKRREFFCWLIKFLWRSASQQLFAPASTRRARGEKGDYILSVSFRSDTGIMKEARLWICRRTMQSAAPDTSRQKEATAAFPHSLIQLLSGRLSPEYIIIQRSIRFFRDATLSLIRIYWMHTCTLLLERIGDNEFAGCWREELHLHKVKQ